MRRLWLSLLAFSLLASACAGERPTFDEGASREVPDLDESGDNESDIDAVTLRLAVPDGWSADPAEAGPASVTNRVIADLLYEGLSRFGDGGALEPGLADQWFVDEARTTWTFVLPGDLADNTGAPITARDVKLSLERIAARGAADQVAAALTSVTGWRDRMNGLTGGVAGISAPDGTTLVIRLDAPFEPLLEVLASPAFGITGTGDDGVLRTTGAYQRTDEPATLAAAADDAVVREVLLVGDADGPAATLAAGEADWGVLPTGAASSGLDADIVRQPLDLELALVARHHDEKERLGTLAALQPLVLAGAVGGLTARPVPPASSTGAMPEAVLVDVPTALAPIGELVAEQLVAAGVHAAAVPSEPSVFAQRVAEGEALLFPIVVATGAGGSIGLPQIARPAAEDDVFGVPSDARAELAAAATSELDPAQRALFIEALERALIEDGLLLPIGRYEVRIGIGHRLDALRHRADGTLDLRSVALADAT